MQRWWIFPGFGALGVVLGFHLIYALGREIGVAVVIPALIAGVIGTLVLVLTYVRRYAMILPPQPPD